MSDLARLWYFADPMCSWCWGFSPVLARIEEDYRDRIAVHLILGGLRPGTTEAIAPHQRQEILHHWHAVHARTGQPFRFEGAMPEGFVYDTEIPSRGVVAVSQLAPERALPYFRATQEAFYAEGQDVTRPETLCDLAARQELDPERFRERFESDAVRTETRRQFNRAQLAGVGGFPTVILHRSGTAGVLTTGYQPFEALRPQLDDWLAQSAAPGPPTA